MELNTKKNYLNFLLEAGETNHKIIQKELEESGFNTEQLQANMLNFINRKCAEAKMERGKRLKEVHAMIKRKINEKFEGMHDCIGEWGDVGEVQLGFALRIMKEEFGENVTEGLSDEEIKELLRDKELMEEVRKAMKREK